MFYFALCCVITLFPDKKGIIRITAILRGKREEEDAGESIEPE
jgi:hypothetical protein